MAGKACMAAGQNWLFEELEEPAELVLEVLQLLVDLGLGGFHRDEALDHPVAVREDDALQIGDLDINRWRTAWSDVSCLGDQAIPHHRWFSPETPSAWRQAVGGHP
jgi:hypothetical protein